MRCQTKSGRRRTAVVRGMPDFYVSLSIPFISCHSGGFYRRGRGVWGGGRNFRGTGSPPSQRTKVLKSLTVVYPRAPTLAFPQRGPFDSALLRSRCAGGLLVWPLTEGRIFGLTVIMVEGCYPVWEGAGVSSFFAGGQSVSERRPWGDDGWVWLMGRTFGVLDVSWRGLPGAPILTFPQPGGRDFGIAVPSAGEGTLALLSPQQGKGLWHCCPLSGGRDFGLTGPSAAEGTLALLSPQRRKGLWPDWPFSGGRDFGIAGPSAAEGTLALLSPQWRKGLWFSVWRNSLLPRWMRENEGARCQARVT